MLTQKMRLVFFYFLIFAKVQAGLNQKDCETISKYFCLEGPLFLKPLLGGISNAPVCVFEKTNGEEIPFGVLKRERKEDQFAINRFLFLEQIKNQGFQGLPKIIKNMEGGYLTNINGSKYYCFEYLSPDAKEENLSFSFMLAFMGKFHAISANLPNANQLTERQLDHFKRRHPFFRNQLLKERDPLLFENSVWQQIVDLSDFYASSEFEEIYNSLPMQIIHGDVHTGNIIKSNNEFYLIDFDLMRYDIRLWDLSCCISFSFFDEFFEMYKNGTIDSFITSHYELDNINLENCEKTYLCEIVKFRKLEVMSWFLEMMYRGLVDQNQTQVEQFKKSLVNQMADIERLLF